MESLQELPQFVIDALAELSQRTTFPPVPPSGFEPLKASATELRHYWLPVPDDYPTGSPGYNSRLKFLTGPAPDKPLPFAPPSVDFTKFPLSLFTMSLTAPGHPWPAQGSNNWSGGFVTPSGGDSISFVEGTWIVPAVAVPTGGTHPEYQSSTWIGLDGQGAYRDSTLPQIGTAQTFTTATGTATYAAWYQWWAKDVPPVIVPIGLTVNAGDEIYASVSVVNPTTVSFTMKNVTTGAPPWIANVAAPILCVISGATAEWVLERPTPLGGDSWFPYPLPVYQNFSFTGCRVESKSPDGSPPKSIDIELAQLIKMNEITQSGSVRTISVATKTLLPSQSLDLSYTGPV